MVIGAQLSLVESMERSRWRWMNRLYVWIPVCLNLKVLVGFDPLWGDNLIPHYISMAMVGVHLCWLTQWNYLVDPGQTVCTFTHLCAWVCYCHLGINPVCFHNLTPFPGKMLHWRWSAFVILVKSTERCRRTDCTFVLLRFDSVLRHYLTFICCQNVLQWRWLLYVYLGRIDETISLAPDEQAVRS